MFCELPGVELPEPCSLSTSSSVIPLNTKSDLVYDIGGEEVSATTVEEWKQNGLRQADYTKKSQANAEARKANEAKSVQLDSQVEAVAGLIQSLEGSLDKGMSQEDLDYLRENNTGEYLRLQEEKNQKIQLAANAKQEMAALKAKQGQEVANQEAQLLMDANPAWTDKKVMTADIDAIKGFMDKSGITADEAGSNHKIMLAFQKAAKYDALQEGVETTKKQVAKAPTVLKARAKPKGKPKQSDAQLFYGN